WATSPQPNLQPTINLQPRILLHRVANYWEQVNAMLLSGLGLIGLMLRCKKVLIS
ncbi:hypothetical protein SAMN05720354_13422, partial [Nitrosospira sp. Nsp1]